MISKLLVLILTVIFASFMKLADLAEEHSVRFRYGLKYVFAIIWGVAGALNVISGNIAVSSYYIALMFNYIVRFRIDTFTHGLATIIVLAPLLIGVDISLPIFITCFTIMVAFTFIHDRLDDSKKIRKFLQKRKALFTFFEYRMHYYFLFIFVALIFKEWLLFAIPFLGMLSYEIVRQLGERRKDESKNDEKIKK